MTVFGNSIHFVRCPRSKVVIGRLLNRLQVVIRSLLNSLFNCECQTSDACICHACVCVCGVPLSWSLQISSRYINKFSACNDMVQ